MTARERKVTVIGAGMSGCLAAIHLARRGFDVEVYELRGDLRQGFVGPSRSLNMTLSRRGLAVLEETDSVDWVMPLTVPVKGRMVHGEDGRVRFYPYGSHQGELLHAIARSDLNAALMNRAESFGNVRIFFRKSFLRLDKDSATAVFRDLGTQRSFAVDADFIVGADGSFSAVRRAMQRGERADYQQKYLTWDYRELRIPPGPQGYRLEPHALHLWPRGGCMVMALPNLDGSFNCICTMPSEGEVSFASLASEEQVRAFFEARFPDALSEMPTLARDFLRNPSSTFITISTSPWHHRGRVVLVGDACHTVVPFYGQGMIAGFEDCAALDACLVRHGADTAAAFAEYEQRRKRHADALAALSIHNFVELRDRVRDLRVIARKDCEGLLGRLFRRRWIPIYTLIAHTRIPYAEALERYRRQRRIARWLGLDLLVAAYAGLLAIRRAAARWGGRRPGRPGAGDRPALLPAGPSVLASRR
jgi:kynurenine 3-monooxygenase